MRISLVIIVSMGLSVTAFGQESLAKPAGVDVPPSSFLGILPAPGSGSTNAPAFFNRNATGAPVDSLSRQASASEADSLGNVCFKMRTYVVSRDEGRSDAVRPVAYFTCLPGTKVAMKSAEMHQGSPE